MIKILRGTDQYRRDVFFDFVKKDGYSILDYSGDAFKLLSMLQSENIFGKCAYLVSESKMIEIIAEALVKLGDVKGFLIVDQRDDSGTGFRRLGRKFPSSVVECNAILSYKREELYLWIDSLAKEVGMEISPQDINLLLDNLGGNSVEVYRVLEIAKLASVSVSEVMEYESDKALLNVLDGFARGNYDSVLRSLVYLYNEGIDFQAVCRALITRYEIFLKVHCCRILGVSDDQIKMKLKLSRMVANNILSEARMNNLEWIIRFLKSLISNISNPVGYEYLCLMTILLRKG